MPAVASVPLTRLPGMGRMDEDAKSWFGLSTRSWKATCDDPLSTGCVMVWLPPDARKTGGIDLVASKFCQP